MVYCLTEKNQNQNEFGDKMKQYLEVGKLNNTHGIKGELKLTLWCDDIDYLKQFKKGKCYQNPGDGIPMC